MKARKMQQQQPFGLNRQRKTGARTWPVALLAAILILGALAACSANTGNGTGRPDKNVIETSTAPKFVAFEAQLQNAGIAYKKTERKNAAKSIEAMCGASYEISGGRLQIFQFDPSNENYIRIFNTQQVNLPENGSSKVVPTVAYRGVVAVVDGFSDAKLVQQLLAFVSDQWG